MDVTPERQTMLALLQSQDPFLRNRLGHGAFLGTRYPYLYIETPKSGCTTAKLQLWQLEGLGPLPYLSRVHERPAGDPRRSLYSVPPADAVEALSSASVYRFCIWRDPIRRLTSAYWEKIHEGTDPGPEWPQWRALIVRAFGLAGPEQISFEHFARFVVAVPDHQRDHHFMSQRRLMLADHIRYHRIVRLDRYADDMALVFRGMGAPEAEWPKLDQRENASGSEVVEVSPAAAEVIRQGFADDYRLVEGAEATQ